MMVIQSLLQWLTHNPLGSATLLYVAGVVGVLIFAYFEAQHER
jgi:hypothetical protein